MKIAKDDQGKVKLSLVPVQIIRDIALVREYGTEKYHSPDKWKEVELQRYINAFYRHWLSFIEDNHSKDAESGIEHYKHMACNMAFICESMKEKTRSATYHTTPVTDVAEVVRCKDCVFGRKRDGRIECVKGVTFRNTLNIPNMFCSHGVRKEKI